MNHYPRRTAVLCGLRLSTLLVLLGSPSVWAQESQTVPAPLLHWGATPKDVPEGYMVIEGDIIVPIDFDQRTMPWTTDFWPGGSVVYEFDSNVTPAHRAAMRAAMAVWQSVANVSFHEEGSCGLIHCVHIQDSDHNSADVGRQFFRQYINIFNWDWQFIMCHELAHTLGFWHEHTGPDRDTYVQINWQHIRSGQEHNFERHDDAGRYGPYDFDSVMHYDQYAFSSDGQTTITVLPPNQGWQGFIGQRDHLSRTDQMIMSFIYAFPNWRFVDRNYSGQQQGTFLQPYRDFIVGVNNAPNGGTLWVQPGVYTGRGTFNRPMTVQAPLGGVTLN
jgi:hypothetical protein